MQAKDLQFYTAKAAQQTISKHFSIVKNHVGNHGIPVDYFHRFGADTDYDLGDSAKTEFAASFANRPRTSEPVLSLLHALCRPKRSGLLKEGHQSSPPH